MVVVSNICRHAAWAPSHAKTIDILATTEQAMYRATVHRAKELRLGKQAVKTRNAVKSVEY